AISQLVAPRVQALRAIGDVESRCLLGGNRGLRPRTLVVGHDVPFFAINAHFESIVQRALRRQLQVEAHDLWLLRNITKFVIAGKAAIVGAVPKQTFLAMIEIQIDLYLGRVEGQRYVALLLFLMNDSFASFLICGVGDEFRFLIRSRGRTLLLRATPSGRNMAL